MLKARIETERLLLIPLSYRQLLKYLRNNYSLEKELGLSEIPRIVSSDLAEALHFGILPAVAKADASQLVYYTLWTIIHQQQQSMVGDCCFKGPPNEKGEIEIGYGINPAFTKQGFMTEAVRGIILWAWTQPEVQMIRAETKEDNVPSQKILMKIGFSFCRRVGDMLWWQLKKPA